MPHQAIYSEEMSYPNIVGRFGGHLKPELFAFVHKSAVHASFIFFLRKSADVDQVLCS